MVDKDFLIWLAARLVHRYGESPNVDFVRKLQAVAEAQPEGLDTRP